MTSISTSTLGTGGMVRSAVLKLQSQLDRTNAEIASGRLSDPGRRIGAGVSVGIDGRALADEIDALLQGNALAGQRMDAISSAMGAMAVMADDFFKSLIASKGSSAGREILVADARAKIQAMTDLLGTSTNGAFVFSGENSGVRPVEDYLGAPPPSSRAAVRASFATVFGFNPEDQAAASIMPAQMSGFMAGAFANVFATPNWEGAFSKADAAGTTHRISLTETLESTVTANEDGIRDLMASLTAIVDFGSAGLTDETYSVLVDAAAERAARAAGELTTSRAIVGLDQERLRKAGERITVQREAVSSRISKLESVDLYEASTTVNQISLRLQASYAVTARLQQLSILNYI